MKAKQPKHWECEQCGFRSNRSRSVKIPYVGIWFAVCFKCGGKVHEIEEWKVWLKEEQRKCIEERNKWLAERVARGETGCDLS